MEMAYDTFLIAPLEEGERELTIRELTPQDRRRKYSHRRVRAEIKRSKFKGCDVLKTNTAMGDFLPQEWYIKILNDLEL